MQARPAIFLNLCLAAACSDAPASITEEIVQSDQRTVRRVIEDARAAPYPELQRAFSAATRVRIDGRDVGADFQPFVAALTGCRLLQTYAFGGEETTARTGETIIVTDWACPIPAEPDGDTSWTFGFCHGELVSVSNDPVMF